MDTSIQAKLQAISNYFDLGSIRDVNAATGTNQNYFVLTDAGEFLFKIIVNISLEGMEQAIAYLNRLEEYQFSAALYYIKSPAGSSIYRDDDCIAVACKKLRGRPATVSENDCREIGIHLAKLHLISPVSLPEKRNWLDNNYLPEIVEDAKKIIGPGKLEKTLKAYSSFSDFKPETFPQSIVHGDLGGDNCLFVGDRLCAFLDWEEVGIGASVLDFAITILGSCFLEVMYPEFRGTFESNAYKSLYNGYNKVRPLTQYEQDYLETALKYVGLTQSVWSMLHWPQYHPAEELEETKTLFWRFGLDRVSLSRVV